MQRKLTLTLATSMMMFPQIVETIYSPALTYIADGFKVSAEMAAQTLSCYFFAFAFGIVVWGRMCDVMGRRPAFLSGLTLYCVASIIALMSDSFVVLMTARVLAAFGAAVGSIGTQTAMRDCFEGYELAKVFSIMGIAMAVSPAIGVLSGALLTHYWGYQGVFAGLALLAVVLLGYAGLQLPETRPQKRVYSSVIGTLKRMAKDSSIWRSALLIALFNISMFSFYQLGPFRFKALDLPMQWFGYTGLVLAVGVGIGAAINKLLIAKHWLFSSLLALACSLSLAGAVMVQVLEGTLWFVLPMMLVVMAYGIAIPNILAHALRDYKDSAGTAGALLGLMYYLMLGGGLVLAGLAQRLGAVLTLCSLMAFLVTGFVLSSERRVIGPVHTSQR